MTKEDAIIHAQCVCSASSEAGYPTAFIHVQALRLLLDELEKSSWIPVDKWLPDDGRRVLLCDQSEAIHYGTRHHNAWWSDVTSDDVKGVVAWMPLPEPYKAKEN